MKNRETQQPTKPGDTEGPEVPVEEPVPQATEPVPEGGPRIVINPEVFEDKRDALCVAFNEAFRIIMEVNGFNPVSEPTEAQRRFFSDTAYSQDENQLRRTILARICTFDTSVKDPTNEQLAESVEFLETVMEIGAPQNEWEQQAVQRIHDVLTAALGIDSGEEASPPEEPPVDEPTGDAREERAALGGGTTFGGVNDEEEKELQRLTVDQVAQADDTLEGPPPGQELEPKTASEIHRGKAGIGLVGKTDISLVKREPEMPGQDARGDGAELNPDNRPNDPVGQNLGRTDQRVLIDPDDQDEMHIQPARQLTTATTDEHLTSR